MHPHDEDLIDGLTTDLSSLGIFFLKDCDLQRCRLDLYEVLNASKILITDYSSVFYDYLLLDKPIVFLNIQNSYVNNDRGFMVESLESWLPGPIVSNQIDLQDKICNFVDGLDDYLDARSKAKNLHHRFKDSNSSLRVWEKIDSIVFKNK